MSLQRTILRNLETANKGIMTTGTLWSEVLLDVGGVSYSEFTKALRELEEKEQIIVITGEDRAKAKLTDAGRMRLMEK